MRAVVILSHLMDKHGRLSEESKNRAAAATSFCEKEAVDVLITTGWAYRPDCRSSIACAFLKYIKNDLKFTACPVLADERSRDTVGDAFFLRLFMKGWGVSHLSVTTSDYHIERANEIFRKFFTRSVELGFISVTTNEYDKHSVKKREMDSIFAFRDTFQNAKFSDDREIIEIMRTKHPCYNGQKHPVFVSNL